MHPRDLAIKDFTYELPDERIAKYPLAERQLSKLLIYRKGKISEDIYQNLDKHLPAKSLLIFNNTRVIPARLLFRTVTGTEIEVFCLEPAGKREEVVQAMCKTKSCKWICMVGKAGKWKDSELHEEKDGVKLSASICYRLTGTFLIEFKWTPENLSFAEVLEKLGAMPIPPYLKRASEESDRYRYQTVYAKHSGSVAAPTAGLHFTERDYNHLRAKKMAIDFVTLHVGAGTFKPVKSEKLGGHEMHAEWMSVRREVIEHLRESLRGNIVAVGTTSLRTIETLYWMGMKALVKPDATLEELEIKQWEVYEDHPGFSFFKLRESGALEALLKWMDDNQTDRLICRTQLLIAPPYELKIATALITNFHQPNSTLLLLVASILGKDWKKVYNHALKHDFRFLSYGDGSLLMPK